DQFRDFRHGSDQSNTSTLTYQETGTKSDRTYTIEVTFTPKDQEPFDVLIVEHRVYDLSPSEFSSASNNTKEDALLTENYSEVIPYAAFEC
ncbi:hypothetical protein, partial [Tritonibacter sp. SIMBA_163]|uniref:hypothetical protein n=1 Tax=Tritonibacter sp. SIMBA_163 TaxID=3080868 RepID=UPI003980099C